MPRALRFLVVLVLGLALLAAGAALAVHRLTRQWFESDLALRAQLAVRGARPALLEDLRIGDTRAVARLLDEITRDDRVLGAAVCGGDLSLRARTRDYPGSLTCADLGAHLKPAPNGSVYGWGSIMSLPGGRLHVSVLPLAETPSSDFVVLVHDWAYVEDREQTTRRYLFVGFAVLAVLAALVTLVAVRLSWRSWSQDLRRFLRGSLLPHPGASGPAPQPADLPAGEDPGFDLASDFQPILGDVRELVEQLTAEKDLEGGAGWSAQRLQHVLARYFPGEKVLVVANREPYIHERRDDKVVVQHPASGLVTALEPVMRACSGVWVAHASGSADHETADAHGRIRVPPGEESYVVRRVWLSPEEERGYYYGFANEGLWPLCHIAHTRPQFRAADFAHYQAVNQRFAEAVIEEVEGDDPVILVQDYHFALAPRMIRERLPRATIITFWHVPWPNAERFGICPFRDELIAGMLGSSILGFHTQLHCNNFIDAVDRFAEARIDREQSSVVRGGRSTFVRPYPISVEWPPRWLAQSPSPASCRAEIFAELGLPSDALLGVGVDRMDYTKGLEERLLAVERLLERAPRLRGRFVFVQLAAPSRTEIERYRQLQLDLEKVAARINERFGSDGYRPVIILRAHHEPPAVFRYYRAADVCYVSSLHDGMNLVAKEFVAARDDERGALVLSAFTGAARELTDALIVNPYDFEEASAALAAALTMSPDEQRDRMRAMRAFVAEFNVYRWAGRMLVDAARLRRRDRLTHRWSDTLLNP
jgi:trehalose 6-phosphate synthase